MSLHEIALTHGVKRSDTCKLFWGIFGYSIKMKIPYEFIDERREGVQKFWSKNQYMRWRDITPSMADINQVYRDKLNGFIDDIIDKNLTILSGNRDDFYYLASGANVTFYLKNPDSVATLIESNPGCFFAYTAPASEKVAHRLEELAGKKVEVRKTPFYGEFPYRIIFKWERSYAALDERVHALQFEDSLYSEGETRILYIKSEDDFFLAKLGLQDRIDQVTECLTVEEVEA